MFRNYLTIAIRNLLRQKLYSAINIFGLALGMACCILILLFVQDELSYDRYHKNADRIYRVANRINVVRDGEEALDYLFHRGEYADPEKSPPPQVILLDLRLPKLDRLAVLKEIKESENLCRIPVVILTSSGAETDVARAYDYRANSYVVKPVDFEKFSQLMDDLGFYWLGWNHYPPLE